MAARKQKDRTKLTTFHLPPFASPSAPVLLAGAVTSGMGSPLSLVFSATVLIRIPGNVLSLSWPGLTIAVFVPLREFITW